MCLGCVFSGKGSKYRWTQENEGTPFRTFDQMFGNLFPNKVLKPTDTVKLTSSSGHNISCFGSIDLYLHKSGEKSTLYTIYYVYVKGLKSTKQTGLINFDQTTDTTLIVTIKP